MNLETYKPEFDQQLHAYLERKLAETTALTRQSTVRRLLAHVQTLAEHGGKRIRPYLVNLGYRSSGGTNESAIVPACLAVELFHLFCLIHDDVMDNGTSRHGVPTAQVYAHTLLAADGFAFNVEEVSRSEAILLGDMVYAWVFDCFNEMNLAEENVTAARKVATKMMQEVIIGQMLDVSTTAKDRITPADLDEKMALKTARYTFVNPLAIGMVLADARTSLAELAELYGMPLGLAFQCQDDLLDIVASPELLAKDVLRDVAQRQHTYFSHYITEHGVSREKRLLASCWGKKTTETQKQQLQNAFAESGAIAAGQAYIKSRITTAKQALDASSLQASHKEEWVALLEKISGRQH